MKRGRRWGGGESSALEQRYRPLMTGSRSLARGTGSRHWAAVVGTPLALGRCRMPPRREAAGRSLSPSPSPVNLTRTPHLSATSPVPIILIHAHAYTMSTKTGGCSQGGAGTMLPPPAACFCCQCCRRRRRRRRCRRLTATAAACHRALPRSARTPHTSHLTSRTSHLAPHTSHLAPRTSHLGRLKDTHMPMRMRMRMHMHTCACTYHPVAAEREGQQGGDPEGFPLV